MSTNLDTYRLAQRLWVDERRAADEERHVTAFDLFRKLYGTELGFGQDHERDLQLFYQHLVGIYNTPEEYAERIGATTYHVHEAVKPYVDFKRWATDLAQQTNKALHVNRTATFIFTPPKPQRDEQP